MSTQILIKNGLLFTGDKDEKASVKNILITDGKVVKISSEEITTSENTTIIDATDKWITPGFIDNHTHYDAEVLASPGLKESARHGVTTVILGSCSVSAIFNNPEDTSDCFTRVEAIPREVMLPLLEKQKTWNSPKTWKEYINKLPLGINIASFVGHSDLRVRAMGIERTLNHKNTATKEEQEKMNTLLNDALDEGFLGLSTMDNPWDKMDGEKYWSHKTPSFYSSWKERKPLIKILRKRNAILQGVPNLVTRVNGARYMFASVGLFRKPLKTTLIAMMDVVADRYLKSLLQFASGIFNTVLKGDFRMQSLPIPFTVYYDGVDSVMFEEFPSGEAMRHLAKNLEERNELIKNPDFRTAFKKEIANKFAPKVWHRDLSLAVILDCPDKSLIGKNFYDIATEKREHPVETFLDLVIEHDKKIRWTTTIANDRPEKYPEIYNYKHNLIGFTDAGAHLNNMAFYDFGIQMINNVQKAAKNGNPIMPMEKCIWRLTGEQADWFGLDCGYIKENAIADLVIINPNKFDVISDKVHDAPIKEFNNHIRLVKRNKEVVDNVIVGGKVIFENEDFVESYGTTEKFGRFVGSKSVI